MNWWEAVILGLVEGITEYVPVSSTGHLIIAQGLLGLDDAERARAVNAFVIVVQGGAILAVLSLYWERVLQMLRGLVGRDPAGFRLLRNLVIAFLPAAVLGPLLGETIERRLFSVGPVVAALVAGGVFMILVDAWRAGRFSAPRPALAEGGVDDLTWRQALVIGLLQTIAMWPGTSRSMMTITGGVMVGLRPAAAAEFSFLLGLPTLGGACVWTLFKDARAEGPSMMTTLGLMPVVIGLVVATLSAAVAVRWLVGFLNRRGMTPFGVYRIMVGAALLGLVAGGVIGL